MFQGAPLWAAPRKKRARIFRMRSRRIFEAMREIGEAIPEPTSAVDYVEVAA